MSKFQYGSQYLLNLDKNHPDSFQRARSLSTQINIGYNLWFRSDLEHYKYQCRAEKDEKWEPTRHFTAEWISILSLQISYDSYPIAVWAHQTPKTYRCMNAYLHCQKKNTMPFSEGEIWSSCRHGYAQSVSSGIEFVHMDIYFNDWLSSMWIDHALKCAEINLMGDLQVYLQGPSNVVFKCNWLCIVP